MSPKRSRSRSPHHDDRRRYSRRHSVDKSPGTRLRESSSPSGRGSSRSASPSEKHRRRRSHNTGRRGDHRSRSFSPGARDRDSKDRDDPNVCHCLGVFGLSSYTKEKDLRDVFSQYGDIDDICIIYDRQSGHSKGYGFVYFKSTLDAVEARRNTQGLVLDRRPIRVDYSLTLRPHAPTPGRYLGRRASRDYDRYYNDDGDYDDHVRYRDSRRSNYRDWN